MSILLGLVAAAAPLMTVSADDRPTIKVMSNDLDLTRRSDVRRLERRVAMASNGVCEIGGRSVEELAWQATCRAEAARHAAVRVGEVLAATKRTRGAQLSSR